jgi:hypothetical protein
LFVNCIKVKVDYQMRVEGTRRLVMLALLSTPEQPGGRSRQQRRA